MAMWRKLYDKFNARKVYLRGVEVADCPNFPPIDGENSTIEDVDAVMEELVTNADMEHISCV